MTLSLKGQMKCFLYRLTLALLHLGSYFIVVINICLSHNNTVLTKLTPGIWEHSDLGATKSDKTQVIRQAARL